MNMLNLLVGFITVSFFVIYNVIITCKVHLSWVASENIWYDQIYDDAGYDRSADNAD